MFLAVCGSLSLIIGQLWDDLIDADMEEARLDIADQTFTQMRMMLIAHCHLLTCLRNEKLQEAHHDPIQEKETHGIGLWRWIEKMFLCSIKDKLAA